MLRGSNDDARRWGGVGLDFVPDKAPNEHPLRKVGIIGHSYVRRLLPTEGNRPEDEGFYLQNFHQGGARVETLKGSSAYQRLVEYHPDLIFLIIGGNDVQPDTEPRVLAEAIEALARELELDSGAHCIVVGLESRTSPWDITPAQYHKVKNGVNRRLRGQSAYMRDRYMPMCMSRESLDLDGVHLGHAGSSALRQRIKDRAAAYFKTL